MKKDMLLIGDYLVKIAFVCGIIYLFYDIFSIFFPVIIAIFISFVLQPLVKKLKNKKVFGRKMPESIAIMLVLALCTVMLAVAIVFLIRPLVKELSNFMQVLPSLLQTVQVYSLDWLEKLEVMDLPDSVRAAIEQGLSTASNQVLEFAQAMIATTIALLSNTLGIVVLPFLVYYFLKDGSKFSAGALRLLPPMWRPQARAIFKESAITISAYVRGILVVGCIGGCIVGVGTYLIGLEYPYVFAIMAVFAEAIPFIGAILSVIPAFFIAFLKGTDTFIVVVVFYTAYQIFTGYILGPRVQGQYLKMHPVIIIISILIGGKIAGVLGMLFAVPAVAIVRILLKHIVTYPEEEIGHE